MTLLGSWLSLMTSLNKVSKIFFLIFVFEYCHDVKLAYHEQLETKSKCMSNLNKKEFVTLL